VANWLWLASGVKKVEIDTIQHNNGFGMCGAGDEIDLERDRLWSIFVTELTRFNFIWGSLDLLIDQVISQKKIKSLGKINAACEYLKNLYEPEMPPVLYKETLKEFDYSLSRTQAYRSIKKELKYKPYIGQTGLGLLAVYKIRNSFAHGDAILPEPSLDDEVSEKFLQELIKISSRLVLFSIQMLAWIQYRNSEETIDCFWKFDHEEKFIEIKQYLRIAHLADSSIEIQDSELDSENQLKLFPDKNNY
jgi:hypothetical protein